MKNLGPKKREILIFRSLKNLHFSAGDGGSDKDACGREIRLNKYLCFSNLLQKRAKGMSNLHAEITGNAIINPGKI